MTFIDLLFYKLYQAYSRKSAIPIESSILVLAFTRLSMYLFIALVLRVVSNGIIVPNSKYIAIAIIVLLETPCLVWSYRRYYKAGVLEEIIEKYSAEKYNYIKPWHVLMLPPFIFVSSILFVIVFGDVEFLPNSD